MAARSSRIDALRGVAVFGILLMNVWGFVYGYSLYRHMPPEGLGLADKLAVFVVAAFAEQKFYPIFAFLFGAGFALQMGGRRPSGPELEADKARYRRRLRWLVVCGLLHGALLWFGDILLAYSLTGFWLVRKAGKPLAELARSLCLLLVVNAVVIALYAAGMWYGFDPSTEAVDARLVEASTSRAVYTQSGYVAATLTRLQEFGVNISGFVVFGPRLALLFLLGVFAVRLGWLTRAQRHRRLWRRILWTALALGLPFNVLWGLMALADVMDPFNPVPELAVMAAFVDLGGPVLAAALVAAIMLARERALAWLAPVGRMALTNYLSQSVILMLLLQGVGLGWGATLSHAQLLGVCACIMLAQLVFCHWWLASHRQGPMEALWRRYTEAG